MTKKIHIKEPIDPDKLLIEKGDSFPRAYIVELPLVSTPSDLWKTIFLDEWKMSLYPLKRMITIVGRRLRILTTPDEIEGKIMWVKQLVDLTNRRVEEYAKEIKKKEEKEEEVIKQMRERLKRGLSKLESQI